MFTRNKQYIFTASNARKLLEINELFGGRQNSSWSKSRLWIARIYVDAGIDIVSSGLLSWRYLQRVSYACMLKSRCVYKTYVECIECARIDFNEISRITRTRWSEYVQYTVCRISIDLDTFQFHTSHTYLNYDFTTNHCLWCVNTAWWQTWYMKSIHLYSNALLFPYIWLNENFTKNLFSDPIFFDLPHILV